MKRLITAGVTVPVVLAGIFLLPSLGFFFAVLAALEIAVLEFVRLTRAWAPSAPRMALLVLVPAAAVWLAPVLISGTVEPVSWEYLLAGVLALTVGAASLVLFGGTESHESMSALGVLCFGVIYFSLPVATLYYLHRLDPWLVFLFCAIVWLGDTAAYYCGTHWGRHKLSHVSPSKTWEGAIGGFLIALVAAAVWSHFRLGSVTPRAVVLAVVTAIAAQVGDLAESMLKRGAGVKDSGDLLPGHGGMLDRIDAMLFAAPAMVICLWLLGSESFVR
jgi:phosphatidate cytidylyltransferase